MSSSNVSLSTGLLDCLFPVSCPACGRSGRVPFCTLCSEALLAPAAPLSIPNLGEVHAAYEYGGPVALALHALKYEGRPEVGLGLSDALVEASSGLDVDVVLPMPSTPRRLRARGYNPARELARGFGRRVRFGHLRRVGEPPPQVGLPLEARRSNPRGTFAAARVRGARVLVVDDVLTTGATLSAAAEVLRGAGAASVHAVVLAAVL